MTTLPNAVYRARCHERKRSRGECLWCPAPADAGTLCTACAAKNRARRAARTVAERERRSAYRERLAAQAT